MTNYFIVPELGNSGEEHWQTYFEFEAPQYTFQATGFAPIPKEKIKLKNI